MTTNEKEFYQGKVAFVTGAGSRIGRATALAFARTGSHSGKYTVKYGLESAVV